MKRKMISKIMAAALIGTMCAGMAVPVMAADDEKVTLSVINYHVGTDYAAEYYSYPVSYTHLDVYKRQGRRFDHGEIPGSGDALWLHEGLPCKRIY